VSSRQGRRRRGREVNGILLLDKPVGYSSNQALQSAKRLFNANKAGHTGNLDMLATGLLPLCFGHATKVCQFLLDADKHYLSEFTFGRRTSTGDAEGETISERPTVGLDAAHVSAAMRRFLGVIEQVPPMHSALKKNGQPLYKLARQGLEVERSKRQVRIDNFTLEHFSDQQATVDISCSKGTYVRTLAEDVGESLGCGAFVSALRRTGAGPYQIGEALDLETLGKISQQGGFEALDALLLPIDSALKHLPELHLTAASASCIEQGQAVTVNAAQAFGNVRLYDSRGDFVGVGEILADGRVEPRRLLRTHATERQRESAPEEHKFLVAHQGRG
jgi:tRNA pseudouridine55 synthase